MLQENQINALAERFYQRIHAVNTEYLESVGKTLEKIGELRPSDSHKLQQMYDYGTDINTITRHLASASAKNMEEIYQVFDIAAKESYDLAKPFYQAKGLPHVPYSQNEQLQEYVKAIAKQTVSEYANLTQHTAFAVFSKDGTSIAPLFASNKDKRATSLSDTYTEIVDYAVTKVQLGLTDYRSATGEIIKAMAGSGIRTVDYATGYSRRLDTAVRQNLLWGIKECNQSTADFVGEEFGADGYEISYHSHPRPSHEKMGGRQYAKGRARSVQGVYYPSFEEEAEPLLNEYNCLHFKFPVLLGISSPAYTEEELARLQGEDKKTFAFDGKKYTMYEGTQLQRKIESAIRNQKDVANMAKAVGNDDLRREAQYKINQLTGKYARLSEVSGLPTKMERMQVAGLTNKNDGRIIKENSKKSITPITDKAIERIPKVRISGFTDAQNLYIQEQHKDLLKYARDENDNKEVAFVFRKGLKDRTVYKGTDDIIDFGSGLYGKGNELLVMHNHPRNGSYSDTDIAFLISSDDVKTLTIVKNNGAIEVLNKTSVYDHRVAKIKFGRIYKDVVKNGLDSEKDRAVLKFLETNRGMFEWIKE